MDGNYESLSKFRRLNKFPKIGLIEQIFKREKEIRRAIREYRLDTPVSKVAIKGHAFISNPTEIQAIKNITPIKKVVLDDGFYVLNPETWLKVIDATYKYFNQDIDRKAFRMKMDGYNWIQIEMKLCISKTNLYRTIEKAENFALAVACQYQLLKVVDEE